MKPDKLTLGLYFDAYGGLLTEQQRECLDLYCNQDLTLAEIAELMGTSRQGVHDAVSRAKAQLLRYEEILGRVAAEQRLDELAARLEALTATLPQGEATDEILKIARQIKEL